MATYTNLGIKKIATGDEAGTWGDSTNTNFDYFDTSIVGYVAVTLSATGSSGTPNTINVADFSASNGRNRIVEFVDAADLGGTAYVQVTPNDFAGYYFIRNSLSNNRNILFFQGTYDVARAYEIPNATDVVIRCTGSGATSYIYSILDDLSINSATVTDIYAGTTTTTILNATNAQISGGNIDGADLGAGSPIPTAAIDVAVINSATIPTLNSTTIDTTNIEVTNIKAKDGTASMTIANSTGIVTATATKFKFNSSDATAVQVSGADTGPTGANFRITFEDIVTLSSNVSGIGSTHVSYNANPGTSASTTLDAYFGYLTYGIVKGAGATVTDQYGFIVGNSFTDATTNYGFYSNVAASGTSRYGFYAGGTAPNYFGGSTVISVTDNTNAALRVTQMGTANALLIEDTTNPDATPFVVDNSGLVVMGKTTVEGTVLVTNAVTPVLQNHSGSIGGFSWTNNATFPAGIIFSKSKSGVIGTISAVSSGDNLGIIQFNGADNDTSPKFCPGAYITAQVASAIGTDQIPTRLNFATTKSGETVPVVRVSINDGGNVGIGASTTSAAQLLDLRGTNNGLTSTTAVNTLRFTDTDTTTAANQPIGKIEFYNSDTGNAAVGAYILASAAGASGGGKLRLGAAADAGAASDMVTISSNKVEMVGETTSNSFQALGSVYSATGNGLSAFYDLRTYSGASNLSYTTSLYVNDITVSGAGQIFDQYGIYIGDLASGSVKNYGVYSSLNAASPGAYNFYAYGNAPNYFEGNVEVGSGNIVIKGAGAIGYGTGSGGTVTQGTSRTTGVTLNKTNGSITLVSAAGTTTWQSFTVTNSTVAATDVVILSQRSGTDLYMLEVTRVAAGSFRISFATTGGTTTEQPVFNFAVIKAVTA